ncbi:MAG TPA: HAD family hydrolase [Candidatus Marinimicrobia bacterium]|nr:HAD family hydrolase [Candidatus Neomarinimicrobiota bacterium]HRS52565.1 HAD family hydrolase [Candidatus Neomarinimicrobiota bacterium]HRU93266.1 HAD family hydrolase [Candidatus Neomarinimicrobiota bacterium]
MPKDFELIIFDMDGTLYPVSAEMDSIYPIVALECAAKSVNRQPSEIKVDFEQKRAELSRYLNGTPTSTLTLMYFYDADMHAFEREVTRRISTKKYIQPDVRTIKVLDTIRQFYPIFLFTTNNRLTADKILSQLQLADYFPPEQRFTFTDINALPISKAEKINFMKPSTKGLEYILERCGVPANRTLMVGDSITMDIEPARRLGLATYHVTEPAQLYALPEWLEIEHNDKKI